jgi:hypothetical protein
VALGAMFALVAAARVVVTARSASARPGASVTTTTAVASTVPPPAPVNAGTTVATQSDTYIDVDALAPSAPPPAAPSSVPGVTVAARPAKNRLGPVVESPRKTAEAGIVTRTLTFDLTPPMGVTVTVDDQAPRSLSTGDAFKIDGAEHQLVFSCPVCTPVRRGVPAGDQSEMLLVSVPVKPGTLVVDGAVGSTYQIVEHPDLAVRAGTNTIPLRSTFERVTVKDMESGATVSVRLEAAKTVEASFAR